jgi:hypothetical protein
MLDVTLHQTKARRPARAVFPADCTRSLATCASARFFRSI